MAQFMGDLVLILELVIVAAGLYILAIAKKDGSKLIKSSALLLIIGGVFMATCSTYFYMKYYFQGEFESATYGSSSMWYRMHRGYRMGPGMMQQPGGMGPGMMQQGDGMGPGMMQQNDGTGPDMMQNTK